MTAALTEPAGLVDDAEAEAEVDVEIDEVELGRAVEAVVDGVAVPEVTTAAGIWVVRELAVRVRHELSVPDATL
jgi:adenosine/AMP kinase